VVSGVCVTFLGACFTLDRNLTLIPLIFHGSEGYGATEREVDRGMRRLIAISMAVAGAAAGYAYGNSPGNPQTAPVGTLSQQTRVPGEYLVTLAARAEVKAIADLYGRFGIKNIKDLGSNVFLVTLTEDPGPATMEKLRGENPHIKAVEPNLVFRTQGSGGAR